MLALSDDQLQTMLIAAGPLPPEKRSLFLERVAARLQLHGTRSAPTILIAPSAPRYKGSCTTRPHEMKLGVSQDIKSPPHYLDEEMHPRELLEVLAGLRFRNGFLTIQIDRQVRDYLVAAVAERLRKA